MGALAPRATRPGRLDEPRARLARRGGARIVTFHFVCFAWIFFRVGLVRGRVGHDRRASSRAGASPSPLVTSGVLLAIAVGIGSQYLPARFPRLVMARFSRLPVARPGDRARAGADADERPGPGGRGTLHLLPVLMAERPLPPLPPLPEDETRTLERAAAAPAERPAAPRRGRAPPARRGPAAAALERGARARRVRARARRSALLLNAPGHPQVGLQQARRLAARRRARAHRRRSPA